MKSAARFTCIVLGVVSPIGLQLQLLMGGGEAVLIEMRAKIFLVLR
jgi:hypothetical protein